MYKLKYFNRYLSTTVLRVNIFFWNPQDLSIDLTFDKHGTGKALLQKHNINSQQQPKNQDLISHPNSSMFSLFIIDSCLLLIKYIIYKQIVNKRKKKFLIKIAKKIIKFNNWRQRSFISQLFSNHLFFVLVLILYLSFTSLWFVNLLLYFLYFTIFNIINKSLNRFRSHGLNLARVSVLSIFLYVNNNQSGFWRSINSNPLHKLGETRMLTICISTTNIKVFGNWS